jgi:hypothetical protein
VSLKIIDLANHGEALFLNLPEGSFLAIIGKNNLFGLISLIVSFFKHTIHNQQMIKKVYDKIAE